MKNAIVSSIIFFFISFSNIQGQNLYSIDTIRTYYRIYLDLPEEFRSKETTIEFYNLLLQKIQEYPIPQDNNDISISLNEFTNGIYIIRIGNYNKKIVVNR